MTMTDSEWLRQDRSHVYWRRIQETGQKVGRFISMYFEIAKNYTGESGSGEGTKSLRNDEG